MPLFIITKDITKMKVDCIVNAANNSLLGGGGVDGAIHRAAGPDLLKECLTLNGCNTGEAKYTKAYNLPCKYVIHTVGPIYVDGNHGEKELLASCYKESLKIAKELKVESIAFPSISTGVYGYPKNEAFEISKKVVEEFLSDEKNEMDIYFVQYGKQILNISNNFLRIEEKINYIKNKENSRNYEYCYNSKEIIDDEYEEFCYCGPVNKNKLCQDSIILSDKIDIDINLDESFTQMLFRLIDSKGMTDVEAYKKSNINKKLFSKIRSDIYYKPSKNTVLSFIIGLKLNIDEAKQLLLRAGYSLSRSITLDYIIEECIKYQIYNINEINEYLYNKDQPLLGQSTK